MSDFDEMDQEEYERSTPFGIEIDKLIETEVLARLKDRESQYKAAIEQRDFYRQENRELSSENHRLKREQEEALVAAQFKARIDAIQEITGGWIPGQTVWTPYDTGEHEQCPTCRGTKEFRPDIDMPDGTVYTAKISCPTCRGYGVIAADKVAPSEGKIESIKVGIDRYKKIFGIWKAQTNSRNDGYSRDIDAPDCYATLEEAQAECDRRNAKCLN